MNPQLPPPSPTAPLQPRKDPGVAALLEVLPAFFQIFGMGHIYAGNTLTGLVLMLGWWAVCAVNFVLLFLIIGYITWPLCWIAAVIVSSLWASRSAKQANQRSVRGD
jgi:TM2 domain-containing membrane protein YozV